MKLIHTLTCVSLILASMSIDAKTVKTTKNKLVAMNGQPATRPQRKTVDEYKKLFDNNIRLKLTNHNIDDEEARTIAEALKLNPKIKILELDNNNIGDNGAIAIANALLKNTNLYNLQLNNNQITDIGADRFAYALKNQPKTRIISLYHNSGITNDKKLQIDQQSEQQSFGESVIFF